MNHTHENDRIFGLQKPPGKNHTIKKYDFKRPDKFSLEQIRTLSMMHETFARLLSTHLSALLRMHVEAHVRLVDQMTFGEYIKPITGPTCLAVVKMTPLLGTALLHLENGIVFGIVDRLFGGDGKAEILGRDMTDFELSLFDGVIFPRLLRSLGESWGQLIDLKPQLGQIEVNPQFTEIVPPSEMVVVVEFQIRTAEREQTLSLCLPYLTIEPIVPKLNASYWYSHALEKGGRTNCEAVADLKVDSKLYQSAGTISLKDIRKTLEGIPLKLNGYRQQTFFLETGGETVLALEGVSGGTVGTDGVSSKDGMENTFMIVKKPDSSMKIPQIDEPETEVRHDKDDAQTDRRLSTIEHQIQKSIGGIEQKVELMNKNYEALIDRLLFADTTFSNEMHPNGEPVQATSSFSYIRKEDCADLYRIIVNEYPQTIAFLLSSLETGPATELLALFDNDLQVDLVTRIAGMDRVSPDVIEHLSRFFKEKLETAARGELDQPGGVETVIEILNNSSPAVERQVIEELQRKNPELADTLKQNMFVFEDILLLDRKALTKVIENLTDDTLAAALKIASGDAQEHIFSCVDEQKRKKVVEKMEQLGRMKITAIEAAQQKTLDSSSTV